MAVFVLVSSYPKIAINRVASYQQTLVDKSTHLVTYMHMLSYASFGHNSQPINDVIQKLICVFNSTKVNYDLVFPKTISAIPALRSRIFLCVLK